MIAVYVALGASIGAPARYLTDRAVQALHQTRFPWGTLTVNAVASLILGTIAGIGSRLNPDLAALIGTGFCGALSTYSTFGFETMRLAQGSRGRSDRILAIANVIGAVLVCIAVAAIGVLIGTAVV